MCSILQLSNSMFITCKHSARTVEVNKKLTFRLRSYNRKTIAFNVKNETITSTTARVSRLNDYVRTRLTARCEGHDRLTASEKRS